MDECTAARFWSRVDKIDLTGCWLWDGAIAKNLYGTWSFSENGKTKTVYVHRAAYELIKGSIPPGLVLDHQCRVRFCCNPDHLIPVTQKENIKRSKSGEAGAEFQRSKTHCPYGHPYSGDNLYVKENGSRHCRTCARDRMRSKRLLVPPKPRPRKTICVNGHLFSEHGYWNGKSQVCRVCARDKVVRFRDREFGTDRVPMAQRTHCPQGHEYTEENTYVVPSGARSCRKCRKLSDQDRRARARGNPIAHPG